MSACMASACKSHFDDLLKGLTLPALEWMQNPLVEMAKAKLCWSLPICMICCLCLSACKRSLPVDNQCCLLWKPDILAAHPYIQSQRLVLVAGSARWQVAAPISRLSAFWRVHFAEYIAKFQWLCYVDPLLCSEKRWLECTPCICGRRSH